MKQAMLLAACTLALVDSASAPEDLVLAPAEGLVLERTLDRVGESERESTSRRGTNSSTNETRWTLTVTDAIEAVEDGRVTRLARTYESAEMEVDSSFEFGDQARDDSRAFSCELDGATVTWTWDADEDDWVAESDEVDEDVLGRLVRDLDFTALLPDTSVAEGDTWEVDLAAFRGAIDPWRGLPWDFEMPERGDDDEERDGLPEGVTEEGRVTATFEGLREEDGVELAVVTFEGEVEVETDRQVSSESERGSRDMLTTASETRTLEGRVLWNLEGGYVWSLELEVDATSEGSTEGTMRRGDREFEVSSEFESESTTLFTAESRPVE